MGTRNAIGVPVDTFPGVYRGTIEVIDDPEKRKRCRVRVSTLHPPEVETDHLPWAELGASFAGPGFGDLPGYEIGDPVWIAFEGGDRRFPVIMGGILNFEGGLPPTPDEQVGADYEELSARRWTRISRKGIKIEMSDVDEEEWVRIVTPDGSEVRVSGAEGTVYVRAEGRVNVSAPAVNIEASESIVAATAALTADVTGSTTLRCADTVNVRGANRINIGEYTPEQTGATPPLPETTAELVEKATSLVQLTSGNVFDVDAGGELQVDAIGKITIHGQADIEIVGDANVHLQVAGNLSADVQGNLSGAVAGNASLNVQGTLTVEAAQKIAIDGAAEIEVRATAPLTVIGNSTITVEGDADVKIDAVANMNLGCGGVMTLAASAQVKIEAPVVTLDASSTAEMLAGSLCRIDGGVNLIG